MAGVTAPCDIAELLSAYLDGELRDGELQRVVTHIGTCEDCVLEFRMLKEARTSLRLMPALQMPDWLSDSVTHLGAELSAYLDAELNTLELPIVMHHIETCSHCREDLQELDAARTAIRALPRVEPPELLDVRRIGDRPRRQRWQVVTAAAGIAAALVVTFGVATSAPTEAPVDLGSFAERHVARASVETGFSMLPVLAPASVSP